MRTFLFRLIGILQIGGGLFGLVAMLQRLYPGRISMAAFIALLGAIVFILAIIAGVLLLENREAGVRLSRLVQLLQLPIVATPWFSYALHIGAAVPLVAVLHSHPGINIGVHVAEWHWRLAVAGPHTWYLGVNVLALVAWLILRMRRT